MVFLIFFHLKNVFITSRFYFYELTSDRYNLNFQKKEKNVEKKLEQKIW